MAWATAVWSTVTAAGGVVTFTVGALACTSMVDPCWIVTAGAAGATLMTGAAVLTLTIGAGTLMTGCASGTVTCTGTGEAVTLTTGAAAASGAGSSEMRRSTNAITSSASTESS